MNPESFRSIADPLPEAMLLLRDDGVIVGANREGEHLLGRPAGALGGVRLEDLAVGDEATIRSFLRRCARSRELVPGSLTWRGPQPVELRCEGAVIEPATEDRPAILLLRLRPREEASSRFRTLSETIEKLWKEIAERQRVEPALRASEQFNHKVLESTGDAIQVLDLEGRLLSGNEVSRQGFVPVAGGESADDWVANWPEPARLEAARVLEDARRGDLGQFQAARPHSAGHDRWWDVIVTPILGEDEKPVRLVAVSRDITERRLTEEQTRQSAKMEAIGRLAAGLAHDFNNHLHVLGGLATFVARDPGISPRSQEDLMDLRAAVEHMSTLTRQLLAFSRQQVLALETLDLNALVHELEPMVRRLLGAAVEIEFDLGPGPLWIHADRSQLLQVLMNLLINGRDAMPNGGTLLVRTGMVRVQARSNGASGEPHEYVELQVEDSGEGIKAEHLPHIFEPFYTTKPIGRGTGLGLATVHGIVTQGGGHIEVMTRPGAGTTFLVRLLPGTPPPEPVVSDEPRGGVRRIRARILVVEDDDPLRQVLGRTLEAAGFEVIQARHGVEALDRLSHQGPVHLVLSDITMPEMSGPELAEHLARDYPDVNVLWITGHVTDPGFQQRVAGRKQLILQKPVPTDQLLTTIGRVIATPPALRIVP